MPSPYGSIIAQAITDAGYPAHADPATLALIEDCLRTDRTALDHLTREELAIEACLELADLTGHPDDTRTLCELLGLEVPYWVDNPPPAVAPLSPQRTREAILATLRAAFPATRFQLTAGHGAAHAHLVLSWTGGPARTSVDDVVAQFLPHPVSLTVNPRYGCTAIYTCRRQPLPQVG